MSEKSGITHDTASRLIGVTPGELETLVRDGVVRREDKNRYTVPVLVLDYITHLREAKNKLETAPRQVETAAHVDLSDRSVRELENKLGLTAGGYSLTEFRIAYIRHLREQAAGRATEGDLDLATERARLAKEQADKISYQNAITRRELAPSYLLEEVLAAAGAKVAAVLDAIPGSIRRRNQNLTAADIETIASEIAKARNIAAAITLEELEAEASESAAASQMEIIES
jgi:phage terminase Nu1 subunit (DNA packaging protein)